MKKIIIVISVFFIILITYIFYNYTMNKVERTEILEKNKQYEQYCEKEIYGTDMSTIINKVIDSNEKNNIEQDESGRYIYNDYNSINVEIKFKDSENTYNIEQIYRLGIDEFMKNYSYIKFQCKKIEYHDKTSNIRYMYFEEI